MSRHTPRKYTGKHRAPQPPRTCHILDLENLLLGDLNKQRVTTLWNNYTTTLHVAPTTTSSSASPPKQPGPPGYYPPPHAF